MHNQKLTLGRFIWKHVKNYKIGFFFMSTLYGALALERVYLPSVVGGIVDTMTNLTDKANWWNTLNTPLVIIVAISFSMDAAFRVQEWITEYVIPRFKANMRNDVFEYTMHHSSRFFSENHAGSTGGKINTLVNNISSIISKIIYIFAPITLTIFITGIAIFGINNRVGIVYCLWMICHTIVTFATNGWVQKPWEAWAAKNSTIQGKIVDSINNILSVRLFSRQNQELKYYKKYQDEEIDCSYKAGLVSIYVRIILGIFSNFCMIGVIYFIIQQWSVGSISVGQVAATFAMVINSLLMIWWMSSELINFYMDIGGANEALILMTQEHEVTDSTEATELVLKNSRGSIDFRDVCFGYRDENFFNKLNVTIKPGEKVGLVGFSGAGKTTFVNLIMREFDIREGQILINNQNISKVTLSSLRQNIAYITQDISMFHRTIMENIRFGNDDASEEEVIHASKSACCHDFIMRLDKGYDTMVGERGAKLSGGQKQRISIARAILKDSPIIILDEATSALDSVTEKKIKNSIKHLSMGRTTLIIAHRLSTLREVDRILVFENGAIIEDGTHDILSKKERGYYKNLWDSQNEHYDAADSDQG